MLIDLATYRRGRDRLLMQKTLSRMRDEGKVQRVGYDGNDYVWRPHGDERTGVPDRPKPEPRPIPARLRRA